MPGADLLARVSKFYLSPSSRQEQVAKAAFKWLRTSGKPSYEHLANPHVFAKHLSNALRLRHVASPVRQATTIAIQIIAEHLADGDHNDITERLVAHIQDSQALELLGHHRLFTLARAARSAGLFVASGPIEDAAIRAFGIHAQRSRGIRGHLQRLRFGVESGQLEQALRSGAELKQHPRHSLVPEIWAALSYLSLMAPNSSLGSLPPQASSHLIQDYLCGQGVIIYGPGPTDADLPSDLQRWPVARVLMPGVTNWDNQADLVDGRVDIQYANGETKSWLAKLERAAFDQIVQAAQFTTLKSKDDETILLASLHSRVRSAVPWPQFIDGSANMVPIMLWDLLVGGAQSVFVTGASFFLGSQPYRSDHLRYDPNIASRTDAFGSRGQEFERCHSIATHNPLANRRFVKNLWHAKRVQGDSRFQRAVGLSDAAYLAELDALYGLVRR